MFHSKICPIIHYILYCYINLLHTVYENIFFVIIKDDYICENFSKVEIVSHYIFPFLYVPWS